jgi:hypothetical protein
MLSTDETPEDIGRFIILQIYGRSPCDSQAQGGRRRKGESDFMVDDRP